MQPITRKEMYLNRLAGEQAQAIPAEPITREEQYLGRLCGENNVIPEEPRTRKEIYLANLCGEDVTPPAEAITRIEQYMAFASGESESKPEKPITREEMYWDKYQGGDVPEEKTIAFTDIITVTDALARPAVDLQSEITATQNLNGYDYPWVGGAGKNKLNLTVRAQATVQGITSEVKADNTIVASGTSTGNGDITCPVSSPFTMTAGNPYTISINGTDTRTGSVTVFLGTAYVNAGSINIYTHSLTYTPSSDVNCNQIMLRMSDGRAVTMNARIQIEEGSATTYAPYENICPISGRTEVNVTRTGKNLCYVGDSNLFPRGDNLPIINNASTLTAYAKVPKNTNLVFSCATEPFRKIPYGFAEEPQVGTIAHTLSYTALTTTSYAFNSGEYEYVGFYYGSTDYPQTNVQIELGSATEYEPYEGDTFNTELGRTVYGGTLDLTTGELKITHEYARIGDLTIDPYTWSMENEHTVVFAITQSTWGRDYKFKCDSYAVTIKNRNDLENGEMTGEAARLYFRNDNFTTKQEFQTALADVNIVFKLLVPRKYTLTPTEVQMLLGNNTIWADAGRVQLTYLSKAAQRVQSMNASLKANTLKITKAITGGVKA